MPESKYVTQMLHSMDMRNKYRMDRIKTTLIQLRLDIDAYEALKRTIRDECKHRRFKKVGDLIRCEYCGESLGAYCEKNPKDLKVCEYEHDNDYHAPCIHCKRIWEDAPRH